MLATKTTLRSGRGPKWSESCCLGAHSKMWIMKDRWRTRSFNYGHFILNKLGYPLPGLLPHLPTPLSAVLLVWPARDTGVTVVSGLSQDLHQVNHVQLMMPRTVALIYAHSVGACVYHIMSPFRQWRGLFYCHPDFPGEATESQKAVTCSQIVTGIHT